MTEPDPVPPPPAPTGPPPLPAMPPVTAAAPPPPWGYPPPPAWTPDFARQYPSPGLPRVWPALVVPVLAVVLASVAAGVALAAAAIIDLGPDALGNQQQFMDWVKSSASTPGGFAVLLLPGQLVFLGAALGAACLSPVPLRRRLGLNRPSVPAWSLLLLLLGTWFPGMCGDLLMSALFDDLGDNLQMLMDLFRNLTGPSLVIVTLLVSLFPGFGEEMLFRGYTQGRLLQRWHPAAAIGVSSALFAAAHLDPVHVVGVIPLGLWFGVMTWLCGSIWPSILCHIANNAVAVLATSTGLAPPPTEAAPVDGPGLAVLAVGAALCAAALGVMLRYRAPAEPQAAEVVQPAVLPPPIWPPAGPTAPW